MLTISGCIKDSTFLSNVWIGNAKREIEFNSNLFDFAVSNAEVFFVSVYNNLK